MKEAEEEDTPPTAFLLVFKNHTAMVKFSEPLQYADNMALRINETRHDSNPNKLLDVHLYSEYEEYIDE